MCVSEDSVTPALRVAILHLWFEEAPKHTVSSPPHSVSLLHATLHDDIAVRYDVHVDPHALREDLIQFLISILVFLLLRASEKPPESLTAPVAMLGEGSRSHCEF